MNQNNVYAIIVVIIALGLISTFSITINSAFAGEFFNKHQCYKFWQFEYKQGEIDKERLHEGLKGCNSIFK